MRAGKFHFRLPLGKMCNPKSRYHISLSQTFTAYSSPFLLPCFLPPAISVAEIGTWVVQGLAYFSLHLFLEMLPIESLA